eukprot:CAMPEP_0184486322 /NCGR_PEP_ID=MMETSP0113_2-20130426/7832_1 /TAXON_ID=91329 /ORGANISM="Norrisiella sphaerica, Strain BC52" /LENGTH=76 /DNA_ID=CAMNT_0026868139 /DNA_START=154 /DNA_END=380 /DNA_ORIENTATION=+
MMFRWGTAWWGGGGNPNLMVEVMIPPIMAISTTPTATGFGWEHGLCVLVFVGRVWATPRVRARVGGRVRVRVRVRV